MANINLTSSPDANPNPNQHCTCHVLTSMAKDLTRVRAWIIDLIS